MYICMLSIYLSLMSKVFTNDKGITSRYGSRMNSVMTKGNLRSEE